MQLIECIYPLFWQPIMKEATKQIFLVTWSLFLSCLINTCSFSITERLSLTALLDPRKSLPFIIENGRLWFQFYSIEQIMTLIA